MRPDWLERLVEEVMWKRATGRADLHGGNLGIVPGSPKLPGPPGGEFRYFDPSYG